MKVASVMLYAGLSFLLMFLLFRPIEFAFPADRRQGVLRPQWWTDFCFMAGQQLFFNGAVLSVLGHAQRWAHAAIPGAVCAWFGGMNPWGQAILVILVGDFFVYWGHRAQHRYAILWRFHSIHHSAEHMDWLAAHREHPLDSLYAVLLANLPAYALGFPISALAWFFGFRAVWSVYLHANVRLPMGPLRFLAGSPELHHWHHDQSRGAGNYSNVCPLMDVLFGTYCCPPAEPERFGVTEPIARGYVGQLLHPFRSRAKTRGAVAGAPRANSLLPVELSSLLAAAGDQGGAAQHEQTD